MKSEYLKRDEDGIWLTPKGWEVSIKGGSWEFDSSYEETIKDWVIPEGYEILRYGNSRTGFAAILPKK